MNLSLYLKKKKKSRSCDLIVDHTIQFCLCGRDLDFNRAEGVKLKEIISNNFQESIVS